jgi:hypothetical protein
MQFTARNTDLQTLADLLHTQEGYKTDARVHASKITANHDGSLSIMGTTTITDDDGRTIDMNSSFAPSDIALGHFAERLGVDRRTMRKLHEQRPDIWADVVNGFLTGYAEIDPDTDNLNWLHDPDPRTFTVRAFQVPTNPDRNLWRALLSDKFQITDNLDVLEAVMRGLGRAGYDPKDPATFERLRISGCDLSEQRMRVRVTVPAAVIAAPLLFKNYRSPFIGREEIRIGGRGGWTMEQAREAAAREGRGFEPGFEPIMYAGFEFGNGELGDSATYVVPRAEAQICMNGLVLPLDAARKTHVGERLEEGVIKWSAETHQRQLQLITAKVADAVRTFTSTQWWADKVAEIEGKAQRPVDNDAASTIGKVQKALKLTEDEGASVLDMFIRGGQMTAGGVLNAITATAQITPDPDRAADMERVAIKALDLV